MQPKEIGDTMTVFISLLRGVNVGGNKRIKMEALRALYEQLGLSGAQALLQSGNVVFKSDQTDRERLTRQIETGIEQTFGFHSKTILRSVDELNDVIAHNPYRAEGEAEPSKLLVMFLGGAPDPAGVDSILQAHRGPEKFEMSGQEIYVYYPDGMGRSTLDRTLNEKRLKTLATARNWNTILRLSALAEQVMG